MREFNLPVRTGVEVKSAVRNHGRPGFTIETTDGVIEALNIVAATGPFQKPVIPPIAPRDSAIHQIHSAKYYNPQQLPEGAVLVVGAGSSGVQIADELQRAGRKVYLSVGAHDRPPRAYRNRDFCWWLGVLGLWDAPASEPGKEHVTIAVSGAHGGHTVDFRELAHRGITLVGLTESFAGGTVSFKKIISSKTFASAMKTTGAAGCRRCLHCRQWHGFTGRARRTAILSGPGLHDVADPVARSGAGGD